MKKNKNTRRVMVVDDEPHVLTAIEDLLDSDFEVITDTSPLSAIKRLESANDIDVIISDQRMPEWNGHQFLSKARELSDATRLLITGYADNEAIVSAVNGGKIFGYIAKPWKPAALKTLVFQACDHCEMLRALTEEQRLLDSLLNNIPDAIQFKGRDHRFLRGNQGYAKMMGAEAPEALIDRHVSDFLAGAAAAETIAEDERIMETGVPQNDVLISLQHEADTQTRWYSVTKAPMRDERGEITGLVGIARDITKRKQIEEALFESQAQSRTVVLSALDAFVMFDRDGSITDWSPQATTAFGWSTNEILGRDFADTLLAEPCRQAHRQVVADFLAAEAMQGEPVGHRLEWTAVDRTGRSFPIELSLSPLHGRNGLTFSAFIRDVTTRKDQEAKIVRLTRLYAVSSEINGAILRMKDRQTLFEEACRIVIEAGRFTATWIGMVDALGTEIVPTAMAGFDGTGAAAVRLDEERPRHDEGRLVRQAYERAVPAFSNAFDAALRSAALPSDFGSMIVLPLIVEGVVAGVQVLYARERDFFDDQELALLRDMTANLSFALEHIAKGERLDYLAYYDGLTGLPNRTLFTDRLTQQISASRHENRRLALVLVDLERFRNVNETLGLSAGDALLKEVAVRFEKAGIARDNLSRINSDCFGITVLDVKSEADVAHVAQQLIMPCFDVPFHVSGQEVHVAAAAGIALFPNDGLDAETLFSNAEIMLKRAKQTGEKFLFYAPGMNSRVAQQLHLETRLRKALENKEFILHYQPKIELRSGQIIGLEALIRWQDASGLVIAPIEFIGVLEETGLIIEVGKWAMGQAIVDYGKWLGLGLKPPRIAVNVSPIQLRHREFVATISRILDDVEHARDCLDLEITESVLMEDIEANIQKLRIIKKFGVKIAVDDFGTGYSSLAYTGKLPIDALKIDRLFTANMAENPDDLTIVTTIISLGHSLNLKITAEGVETEEQAKLLRLLRCDETQGYLYARPLSFDGITERLRGTGAVA